MKGPDGSKKALKVKFAQEGATERSTSTLDLAVQMQSLGLAGTVQGAGGIEKQTPNTNGNAAGQAKQATHQQQGPQLANDEPDRVQARRRSSLPIVNGSLSIPADSGSFSGSAVGDSVSEDGEISGETKGSGGRESNGRGKERHEHKGREKEREKKHHGHVSGGKSNGKKIRK